MASPMGPPGLPALGYSLRVQLFAANSHAVGDRPIRCFRVVTTPDVTVRDFCQEASRIHEINYGEPIAIKKVQDDQEFDITQSEVIGNLFSTASTIRVIQAAANPTIRDSVPPNSALRFEPSRKREREGSVRPNGEALASSWKTNKRQRVDPDPDLPLPSRESEVGVGLGINGHKSDAIIPNSQESVILGETGDTSRHVRKAVHRIPETPEPSLPPALHDSISFENGVADKQGRKSTMPSLNDALNPASPSKNSRAQSQVSNPAKAKSASYHIPRSTERGTSVSTAATSPQSVDQQVPQQNGVTSANKRKRQDPSPKSNGRQHRSLNEESTYENIISDDEESALTRMKQAALKIRNSPKSGLKGLEWAKDRLSTPPNGNRRTSRSRDEVSSHSELPLTPNSKEREEKQRQRKEADQARKARLAAAEAAEQRKREVEEARLAEEEGARREEQERLEIEDFQRGEAERQAAIAKAARLQKEREAKEKREAEERRLGETRIAREKAESQRLAREKAAAEEAKRLQKEGERREKEKKAEESKRLHEEEARKENERVEALSKISSSPPESLRHLKSSSPILPPSTTKLIPTGRKSALKGSLSSSQAVASSPAVSKLSPERTFNGVSIEQQMPLPKAKRVSFTAEAAETSIKPSISRILPPKLTAKAPLPKPVVSRQNSTPEPPSKTTTVRPPGRQSNTPIPLPQSVVKRQSSERSITPTVPTKVPPPQKKPTPQEAAKKISPPAKMTPRKSETPAVPSKKQPSPLEISSDESGSDEDIPSRVAPVKSALHSRLGTQSRSPAPKPVPHPKPSDEDDEESEDDEKENQVHMVENEQVINEDETQSQNSSTRDSRSPVVFSQHAQATATLKRKRSASPESENGSPEDDDDEESSESGSGSDEEEDEEDLVESKANAKKTAAKSDEPNDDDQDQSDSDEDVESTASDSESDDQGPAVQVPKSSAPTLPPSKQAATGSGPKLNQVKRKDPEPDSPESTNTQDELDQQLTSSLYEARSTSTTVPVPLSSASRPTFKFGASLSSLNSNKPILGSSSASKTLGARGSQRVLNQDDEESEEESEEESDEDSSSSSAEEDEEDNSKPQKRTASKPRKKLESSPTSDDESSDSESESEDEEKKLRDELAAQIAGLGNGDSQGSSNAGLLSPKAYRSSTQQSQSAEKKRGKTSGRVISGYSFSQPV